MTGKQEKVYNTLNEQGIRVGRIITSSKSWYLTRFPNNLVVFNGNIITDDGKTWWGDLDLTLEGDKLQNVANITKQTLYVLREMDCRFENENLPVKKLKEKAITTYTPNE